MNSSDSERSGNDSNTMTPVNGKSYYLFSGTLFFMVLIFGAIIFLQGSTVPEIKTAADDSPGSYQTMDYGPVIAESITLDWPENHLVRKGLAIRLDHNTSMIFDTDLVHFAAANVDGWLDISKADYTSFKGSENAQVEGRQVFGSSEIAGWASGGSFYGPRKDGMGNLPKDWAHYRGYYRHGDQVVLSYTVGGTEVLELPGAIKQGESRAFVRTLQVSPADRPMQALILEMRDSWSVAQSEDRGIILDTGDGALGIRLVDAPVNSVLTEKEGRVELHLPPSVNLRKVRLMIFEMDAPEDPLYGKFPAELDNKPVRDLRELVQGGPTQWDKDIEVAGTTDDNREGAAYVIDRVGIPFDNPWGSWMKLTGFDFFEDGTRAAVSTQNGDVWIVSGIDETLENVSWRRFASGLFYPMGVAIVDEEIYVTERSQLTRLHDLNGDGEADYYENFNNEGIVHPMAHSLGLEVDSEGNFYFFKNGNRVPGEIPLHGALMRVSPDGATRDVFARGFRGANTLGIGPDDTILSADQEGNWVPVERVDVVEEGGFYGYRPHGGESLQVGEFNTPVTWMPREINNSSGSMTYAGDRRWGPLAGHWILGSYGQGTLLTLLTEEKAGRLQGGVIKLPLETNTGLVRGRMNPADGQLFVLGMSNWGRAAWDAEEIDASSFLRIRYTGENTNMAEDLHVTRGGVEIGFTDPLDPASARDIGNYAVERWEYIYSERYGSPKMSLEHPEDEGTDPVEVSSVTVSGDGKKVFLEVPDMRSVMQMKISYELTFKNGDTSENAIYHTVNWLSGEDAGEKPEWQQRIISSHKEEMAKEQDAAVETEVTEAKEDIFGNAEIPDWYRQGKVSFQTRCSECHVNGGVAPSFDTSEWASASSPEAMIRILLHGKRSDRGVMAPFSWMDDEEVASVISYIRARWHEKPDPVSTSQIKETRKETEDRRDFYTEKELQAINE